VHGPNFLFRRAPAATANNQSKLVSTSIASFRDIAIKKHNVFYNFVQLRQPLKEAIATFSSPSLHARLSRTAVDSLDSFLGDIILGHSTIVLTAPQLSTWPGNKLRPISRKSSMKVRLFIRGAERYGTLPPEV
jgi:hypothetical protein